MMIEPRVSVLMPAWNAERFLDEAVASVLEQTLRNFELIAIDDGSSDGSKRRLEEWASRDSRVVVLSRPDTGFSGIAGALNDGLERARGEYIARMDADDVCYPERFERQVEFLDRHPECALVGCDHLEVDAG